MREKAISGMQAEAVREVSKRKSKPWTYIHLNLLVVHNKLQNGNLCTFLGDTIVNRVTILCYPLVCVHCGPVVDFFITKQTSLHPFDFVRNLFHLLVCILFS